MSTQIWLAIISGIVAISVALISKTEIFSRKHYGIRKDVELYKSLPDSSVQKKDLMNFIDKRIGEYITKSIEHRRSGVEIAIGFIFLPIGSYLSWFFITRGSWWLFALPITIFMLLIGLYGMVNGFRKAERDEKGNIVSKK